MTATRSHCVDRSLLHPLQSIGICFHFDHISIIVFWLWLSSVLVDIERNDCSQRCFDFLRSSSITETQTSLLACLQNVKVTAVTEWSCSFLTLFASLPQCNSALSLRQYHSHNIQFSQRPVKHAPRHSSLSPTATLRAPALWLPLRQHHRPCKAFQLN